MRKYIILAFFLISCCVGLQAQNSTQGKEFWFTFMQNGYKNNGGAWVSNRVMISAKRACSGVIKKADGSLTDIHFSVKQNNITIVDIPESYSYNEFNEETIDNQSLVLVATDTVSVFICNIANNSFDASFVLPVESLGSDYIIQSGLQSHCENYDDQQTSCFVIIAMEDGTEVDVTPSVATTLSPAGVMQTISLSRGETYFVRSNFDSENRDLSGSMVTAHGGKNIAVFNGNTLTCIPDDVCNGMDHIFEQALPVSTWGTEFVVTSSQSRVRDFVRVTSSASDNVVKVNGVDAAVLGAGGTYTFELLSSDGSCYVETSAPSVVYLYNTTGIEPMEPSSSQKGDPSMVWIPPVEQRIGEITFCTFNHSDATIDEHFVNIVVETKDIDKVYFDGALISDTAFHPVVGNKDYSFVKKQISHDTHHLSCFSGVIAHVYGFGEAKGYAYCVGANVIDLTSQLYVNGLWNGFYHNGLKMCSDERAQFKVITNYYHVQVNWSFGDGKVGSGIKVSHKYAKGGDYEVRAIVKGYTFNQESISDTLTIDVHVGDPVVHRETHILCDEDSFDFYGVEYSQSGYYERLGTTAFGCDSSYYLTLDLGFTPDFEFVGTHFPIGGSETHISVNEYALDLVEERTQVDTAIWEIDCPNWYLVPHGKGMSCTLYVFSYLLDTVMLRAQVINRCDTVQKEFFIRTSYYDLPEHEEQSGFELAPNPTHGMVTLFFGDLKGPLEIRLFNSMGAQLDAFAVDADLHTAMEYEMPQRESGMYYFVLKSDNDLMVRKVMLLP
jgi:hypothetical protein